VDRREEGKKERKGISNDVKEQKSQERRRRRRRKNVSKRYSVM
jgi:hypothetical protein